MLPSPVYCSTADDEALARNFLYCAALTSTLEQRSIDPTEKKGFGSQTKMFVMNSQFLTSPEFVKFEGQKAISRLNDDANAEIGRRGNFLSLVTATYEKCFQLQHEHMPRLMKLATRKGESNFPQTKSFSPALPMGEVSERAIADSLLELKALPNARVDNTDNGVIVVLFSRSADGFSQTATHMFTKPTNPAHPAMVFGLVTRAQGKDKPTMEYAGSYAGSKVKFEEFFAAVRTFAELSLTPPRQTKDDGR